LQGAIGATVSQDFPSVAENSIVTCVVRLPHRQVIGHRLFAAMVSRPLGLSIITTALHNPLVTTIDIRTHPIHPVFMTNLQTHPDPVETSLASARSYRWNY